MTKRQKLMLEQSEKRQRLNELLAKDEMTDDERGEMETLTARMQALEPEMRAAIVAEGAAETRDRTEFGDDPEGRELRALVADASAGAIFAATLEHRATDGKHRRAATALRARPEPGAARDAAERSRNPRRDTGAGRCRHQPTADHPGRVPAVLRGVSRRRHAHRRRRRGRVSRCLTTSAVVGVPAERRHPERHRH